MKIFNELGDNLEKLDTANVSTNTITMDTTTNFLLSVASFASVTEYGDYGTLSLYLVSPFPLLTTHSLVLSYDPL